MNEIWTLVCGAWGDALASYGNICKVLDEKGLQKANVVYYGLDKEVSKFLKHQKRIDKVMRLDISEPLVYFKYAGLAAGDFNSWMKITGLNEQIPDLIPTHINRYYNIENPTDCNRDFEVQIPDADPELNLKQYEPYILFQPYSCHSCTFDKHWPHWMEALNWVLENVDGKVVLVGNLTSDFDQTFKFPWIEHPRLVNLVGSTTSMVDVFHLMNNANGVVTTSNALSIWSILTKKPALVVCNQIIKERSKYYYNWIHHEPNKVLEPTSTLLEIEKEFRDWFPAISKV